MASNQVRTPPLILIVLQLALSRDQPLALFARQSRIVLGEHRVPLQAAPQSVVIVDAILMRKQKFSELQLCFVIRIRV